MPFPSLRELEGDVSLTVGLSHLLVVDAGPVPIQQGHWEGDHVPRSEDLGDVGLHVLIGQKAISAVRGGEGWGVSWDAQLALTRFTRMAPLSSLAREVPFRKAELGAEPAGRGAGMRCRGALQGQGGNLSSQLLFLLGAVSCAWAGAEPLQGQQSLAQDTAGTCGAQQETKAQGERGSSSPAAKCVLRAAALSRCLGPRGRAG